jgi:hypothetical protein
VQQFDAVIDRTSIHDQQIEAAGVRSLKQVCVAPVNLASVSRRRQNLTRQFNLIEVVVEYGNSHDATPVGSGKQVPENEKRA